MKRFQTLMLREWMQYQTGWLVMLAVPLVLALLLTLAGQVHFNFDMSDGQSGSAGRPTPLIIAMLTLVGGTFAVFAVAAIVALFQTIALARRDEQDRSIEFWLSMPASHVQSLAAPLVTHLLAVPWVALLVGAATGGVLSLLWVAKAAGFGAWFALPWGAMLATEAALLLRLAFGLVLALLWLSPIVMALMVATAWLKRWGLAAVVVGWAVAAVVVRVLYGSTSVANLVSFLLGHARRSLLGAEGPDHSFQFRSMADLRGALDVLPGVLAGDALDALAALATPQFALAIVIGALGFALLLYRRRRGA